MKNNDIVFELENVSKKYNDYDEYAINNISLKIFNGSINSIMGESGSGKTTILNLMSTLDTKYEGKIKYKGKSITGMTEVENSKLRMKEFGFIFQDYLLIPTINVEDNICLNPVLSGSKIDKDLFYDVVKKLKLENKLTSMPNCLSGGQQQRVAIARAIIGKPNVIFADEPTGNLDSENSQKVMKLLLKCVEEYKQTLIYVTHDMSHLNMAQRILTMKDGKVIKDE